MTQQEFAEKGGRVRMINFEELRHMITEIDKLCDTVDKDNKRLRNAIEEKKEIRYFNVCTDLSPYYELYKDKFISSDINVDTGIKQRRGNIDREYVIAFHAGQCYLCEKDYSGISMNIITRSGTKEFKPYESLNGRMDVINYICKYYDAAIVEKNFTIEVQKKLIEKAERLNKTNEELKIKLNEV